MADSNSPTAALDGYLEAERAVFAGSSIEPKVRTLSLAKPATTVRAVEFGSGDPVLLMHGILLCTAHWAPLLARMNGQRAVAIDMPGHGGSGSVDFRGVDLRSWHVGMVTAALDAMEIDSATLIGHSYGGLVALWTALDSPERVRSLILIGAPAVGFGGRPDLTFRSLGLPGIGPLMLRAPSPLLVYRRTLATGLGHKAVAAMPTSLVRANYLAARGSRRARTVSTFLREQFRGISADPPRYVLSDEELARIEHDALIVWGDQDTRFQSVEEAQRRAALMPRSSFVSVPGGHEPWFDDLDAVLQPVTGFLARDRAASPGTTSV